MYNLITNINRFFECIGELIKPITLLLLRLYVASVFLKSGIQKISNWDTTKFLFELEYNVPILSPTLAAILGTAAEIILPVLIIFGFFTRASSGALFIFNIVAVASYPKLLKGDFSIATYLDFIPVGFHFPTHGFDDHVAWGLIALAIMTFGAGKISIDNFFKKHKYDY